MTSIYRRALGSDFSQLHPQIQRRFALNSQSGIAAIGTGTMDRIWHGAPYTLPFLHVGTWRSIMFPEHGIDVPFTIENYGGLHLRSGEQRFYEGVIAFRFPLFFSGVAEVCEWFDDAQHCFRIQVSASNRTWGDLFGYSGSFKVDWRSTPPNYIPNAILPKRVECRT
jgi:Domain of unknown function (DUF4166)